MSEPQSVDVGWPAPPARNALPRAAGTDSDVARDLSEPASVVEEADFIEAEEIVSDENVAGAAAASLPAPPAWIGEMHAEDAAIPPEVPAFAEQPSSAPVTPTRHATPAPLSSQSTNDAAGPATEALALPAAADVRLMDALLQRVHVAKYGAPLWALVGAVSLALAVFFGVFGLVVGLGLTGSEGTADDATSGDSALSADTQKGEVSAPSSDLAREASARTDSIEALEGKAATERSLKEALALTSGKLEHERKAARELRRHLLEDPTLIKDATLLKDLQRHAASPVTAVDALGAMAELPGPVSADLVYDVWTGTAERNLATELAEALVYSKDVYVKASPALKVALDLRRAESCEETQKILPRAIEQGDRRSLHLLERRLRKYGCGATKKEDCYKCLRDGDELKDAIKAVRTRQRPRL